VLSRPYAHVEPRSDRDSGGVDVRLDSLTAPAEGAEPFKAQTSSTPDVNDRPRRSGDGEPLQELSEQA
jgi:hypothetical protein